MYDTDNACTTIDQRPLDSIATAAQRINTAQVQITRFLDRFHGPQPEKAADGMAGSQLEPTMPHSQNLNRLFAAIDRLDARVEALNQIG